MIMGPTERANECLLGGCLPNQALQDSVGKHHIVASVFVFDSDLPTLEIC